MSAFNTIQDEANCPSCGARGIFEVQFKYGNTWQLHYQLGDTLRWGGNDIGVFTTKKVAVEGIGDKCTACGHDMLEFDLMIVGNVLTELIGVGESRATESELGYRLFEE
jgi:hypothetical protein